VVGLVGGWLAVGGMTARVAAGLKGRWVVSE
jgi:hypothetical protein